MNITYKLIPGGYEIESDDGSVRIRQDCQPVPGLPPYTEAEAEAAAQAKVQEVLANLAALAALQAT